MISFSIPGMARVYPSVELWRPLLDKVALQSGHPESTRVRELGAAVRGLSLRYNEESRDTHVAMSVADYAARLQFQFLRDLPKACLAMREVIAARSWQHDGTSPLRVLDVGAGLGAMTWGVIEALEETGAPREWDLCMIDRDPVVLRLADAIASARAKVGLRWKCDVSETLPKGPWDIIVFGNVLSEIARGSDENERLRLHADLVHRAKQELSPRGVLLVIEPALRTRTRWLHRLRAQVLERGSLHVLAPCLHSAACPMLPREEDWCHEDRPIDLPSWLVPVAKEAGLRWEGLTFSFLALATEPRTSGGEGKAELRVVSPIKNTKGKCEFEVCGQDVGPIQGILRRLDRDRSPTNEGFEKLDRGSVFRMEIHPEMQKGDALRVLRETPVECER